MIPQQRDSLPPSESRPHKRQSIAVHVFASMRADSNEGWVWLANPGLRPRAVVQLRNPENKQCVCVEVLQIDDNFLFEYNQPPRREIVDRRNSIVLSNWYRTRLGGISAGTQHVLEIDEKRWVVARVRACLDHPQQIVRIATLLGLWSVVLGVISVVLGVLSLR